MKFRNIEILEPDKNKKGDLFGRLISDLFHTLGYDEPRLNIHKSGREIDLTCAHRIENKTAIAECKAHADTIGGGDINKFVGVVDAERRKISKLNPNTQTVGYFVSISGFKETAIEQELEFINDRVILIEPDRLVTELIKGKIIVSIEEAISLIKTPESLRIADHFDLLAYDKGWIWCLYYSDDQKQTVSHVAFVHAAGQQLVATLVDELLTKDKRTKKLFKNLHVIGHHSSSVSINIAKEKYFSYLENELGDIQFEGLPTDKEAGSVKVKLENIFVPLHFRKSDVQRSIRNENRSPRENIGEILKQNTRLAILANPGGGKSTLIKRLAIAYAFPDRRATINDKLPDKEWFPIFLRCRELGDRVALSITEIISNIPIRAEIQSCEQPFKILVSQALQDGSAMLLVDGLDEISDDKNRKAFVNQLRTFIATYPNICLIVTSREAGFRVVAQSLAQYCEKYTVSDLIDDEVAELCYKWHKAIIDDSESTVVESKKLSNLILKDDRIKVLGRNPLLLTTLLFVKRWAGYLPTKRSMLYQEMIKLLLVTWNVEGHDKLDIDEAEPQLAYVAYWMTKNQKQTITTKELISCLQEARKEMPEILSYTRISPSEFVKRVELRSSLLILSGHVQEISGEVTAIYEFLHLSFQEYLTAKAIAKKYLPTVDSNLTVVEIIEPNIYNENWKEVIPLTAVLLERNTKELIELLIEKSKQVATKPKREVTGEERLAPFLLGSCLANEIAISPLLLPTAIEWFAKNNYVIQARDLISTILNNKLGAEFARVVRELFFHDFNETFTSSIATTLADIYHILDLDELLSEERTEYFETRLRSTDKETICITLLTMMVSAYQKSRFASPFDFKFSDSIFRLLLPLMESEDKHVMFCGSWAIAWLQDSLMLEKKHSNKFIESAFKIRLRVSEKSIQRVAAWGIYEIINPRTSKTLIRKYAKLANQMFDNPSNEFEKLVAIAMGTILGMSYNKKEIANDFKGIHMSNGMREFAALLDIDPDSESRPNVSEQQ